MHLTGGRLQATLAVLLALRTVAGEFDWSARIPESAVTVI